MLWSRGTVIAILYFLNFGSITSTAIHWDSKHVPKHLQRRLVQTRSCEISDRLRERFFDASSSRWRIDRGFLEQASDSDLQHVVDCTPLNGVIEFRTAELVIEIPSTLILTQPLTIRGIEQNGMKPGLTCSRSDAGLILIEDSGVILENLEILNCAVEDNGHVLELSNSDVTVRHCSFRNNSANSGGVMFAAQNTSLRISSSEFISNSASNFGGVLTLNKIHFLEIKDSIFLQNSAKESSGGAIDLFNDQSMESTVQIMNSSFEDNIAETFGGALHFQGQIQISISFSKFTGNSAKETGGAISFSNPSSLNLTGLQVLQNAAKDGAGMYLAGGGFNALIQDSNFENNSAEGIGGGVFQDVQNEVHSVSIEFVNCTFLGNSAFEFGGGMSALTEQFQDHSIHFLDSLFVNNTCENVGGGLTVWGPFRLQISNSSYLSNKAGLGGGLYLSLEGVLVDDQETQVVPTVENSIFRENEARLGGGGMILGPLEPQIRHVHFTNNSAATGGALYLCSSTNLTLSDSFLFQNEAQNSGGGIQLCPGSSSPLQVVLKRTECTGNLAREGGCLAGSKQGIILMEDVSILRNNASSKGGGISMEYSNQLMIQSSTIESNVGSNGGAIFIRETPFEVLETRLRLNQGVNGGALMILGHLIGKISDCIIEFNQASIGGALYLNGDSSNNITSTLLSEIGSIFNLSKAEMRGLNSSVELELDRVILRENQASAIAGSIFSYNRNLLFIKNSDISQNWAEVASGGIHSSQSSLFLYSSFLRSNRSPQSAGAIHFQGLPINDSRTVVYFSDVEFVNNTAGGIAGAVLLEGPNVESYCKGNISFRENQARFGGALFVSEVSNLTLSNSTQFVNNSAVESGGALVLFVSVEDHEKTVKGTGILFKGNRASRGGAVMVIGAVDLSFQRTIEVLFTDLDPVILMNFTQIQFMENEAEFGQCIALRGVNKDAPNLTPPGPVLDELLIGVEHLEEALSLDSIGDDRLIEEGSRFRCQFCEVGIGALFESEEIPDWLSNLFQEEVNGFECVNCNRRLRSIKQSQSCDNCSTLFLSVAF